MAEGNKNLKIVIEMRRYFKNQSVNEIFGNGSMYEYLAAFRKIEKRGYLSRVEIKFSRCQEKRTMGFRVKFKRE
jgi:hypothetical protein